MESTIAIEIDGQTKSLKQWADHYKVQYIAAYRRYKRGKVGVDIFKVKPNRYVSKNAQGKAEGFVEMGQLNIAMPQWQIDALERIARLNGVKRTKYAHQIIAKHLQASAQTQT